MNKRKVKMLVSISGLADPNEAALDQKYARLAARLKEKQRSEKFIELTIAEQKRQDRYGDVKRGFTADFAFKPGDEVFIPADVADKWEADGTCAPIDAPRKAA